MCVSIKLLLYDNKPVLIIIQHILPLHLMGQGALHHVHTVSSSNLLPCAGHFLIGASWSDQLGGYFTHYMSALEQISLGALHGKLGTGGGTHHNGVSQDSDVT
jgi:hypothetical protein